MLFDRGPNTLCYKMWNVTRRGGRSNENYGRWRARIIKEKLKIGEKSHNQMRLKQVRKGFKTGKENADFQASFSHRTSLVLAHIS